MNLVTHHPGRAYVQGKYIANVTFCVMTSGYALKEYSATSVVKEFRAQRDPGAPCPDEGLSPVLPPLPWGGWLECKRQSNIQVFSGSQKIKTRKHQLGIGRWVGMEAFPLICSSDFGQVIGPLWASGRKLGKM